jgi:type II secretory pathway predicted ATPase ExeA
MGEYIAAHLAYAGGQTDIFTDAALEGIYKYSSGMARKINKICTNCLMAGFQRGKKRIDEHMVKTVAEHEMS